DGIRDDLVTGVQTCALPIYLPERRSEDDGLASGEVLGKRRPGAHPIIAPVSQKGPHATGTWHPRKGFRWSMGHRYPDDARPLAEIGRASCRESAYEAEVAVV